MKQGQVHEGTYPEFSPALASVGVSGGMEQRPAPTLRKVGAAEDQPGEDSPFPIW